MTTGEKEPKQVETAEIKMSRITEVAHVCRCDDSSPSFLGEVVGTSIAWPVAFGRLEVVGNSIAWPVAFGRFQMSYCPWCGKKLPKEIKKEDE